MIGVSVQSNIDQVASAFDKMAAGQIPYATSLAINRIAEHSKSALRAYMNVVLDRPKTYTLNSLYVKYSNKTNLTARVGHKDQATRGTPASAYLRSQIEGGQRQLTPFERILDRKIGGNGFFVPAPGTKLDAFGNLPRSVRAAIIVGLRNPKKSDYFLIKPGQNSHLKPGIYQRVAIRTQIQRGKIVGGGGSRLKCIMLIEGATKYRAVYDMLGVVNRTIESEFSRQFASAMDFALSNGRISLRS